MCLTWEKLCVVGITLFCVRRLSFVSALLPWNKSDDICRARFSCLEIQNSLPALQTRLSQTGPVLENQAGVCQEAPQSREIRPVLGHGAVQGHPCVVHRIAPLLKAHRGGVQERTSASVSPFSLILSSPFLLQVFLSQPPQCHRKPHPLYLFLPVGMWAGIPALCALSQSCIMVQALLFRALFKAI